MRALKQIRTCLSVFGLVVILHFEQAFSDDGGKSWEVNWIALDTRVKEPAGQTHQSGRHDWRRRLASPGLD
jgi:hypothetical protein